MKVYALIFMFQGVLSDIDFYADRDTLWEENKARIHAEIKGYADDKTEFDGLELALLHNDYVDLGDTEIHIKEGTI